jgi:uncharacterized protein
MKDEMNDRDLSRRDFLRRAAGAAAALGVASAGLGGGVPAALAGGVAPRKMTYRVLGRTKLKVSALGMGTIRTSSAAVIRRAMDLGINFFDTAECYREGNSEIDLGKALKGRRDKAIVATKWHTDGATPARDLIASVDGSLKRLGMDHVELIQIHGAERPEHVQSEELWKAFTTLKQAGKVRFNGLSTHSNQVEVLRAAIKTGWYDAVLPAHSALTADRIGPVLSEARAAGVGVIIMKALLPAHEATRIGAFKALKGNSYQQSIQWMLRDKSVSTVIVDMPSFDLLEEDYAAVVGAPMSQAQLEDYEGAVRQIAAGACHMCGACTGQCTQGIRVADVMRHLLYHDGYGDKARAVALYRDLPTNAAACGDCASCPVVCPWGVPVRERLARAHTVLA